MSLAKAFALARSRLATAMTVTLREPRTPSQNCRAIFAAPRIPMASGRGVDGLMCRLLRQMQVRRWTCVPPWDFAHLRQNAGARRTLTASLLRYRDKDPCIGKCRVPRCIHSASMSRVRTAPVCPGRPKRDMPAGANVIVKGGRAGSVPGCGLRAYAVRWRHDGDQVPEQFAERLARRNPDHGSVA